MTVGHCYDRVGALLCAEVVAELELTPNAAVLAKFRVLRRLRQELDGLTDSCP